MNSKTELDRTEREAGESVALWLARLVLRAQLSDHALANITNACHLRENDAMHVMAAELADMRAHQAYGQVRQAARAANRYLGVIEDLEDWMRA